MLTSLSTGEDFGEGCTVIPSATKAEDPKLEGEGSNSSNSNPAWEESFGLKERLVSLRKHLQSTELGASIKFCSLFKDPVADAAIGKADKSRAAGPAASEIMDSEVKVWLIDSAGVPRILAWIA